MKNKIIGIFCMAPLTALLIFIIIKAIPVVVERMGERIQGIETTDWLLAFAIVCGLVGIITLFSYGWRKFIGD